MKVLYKVLPAVLLVVGVIGSAAASEYEDSKHYNYVGFDFDFDLLGIDNELVGSKGGGITAGFLHSPSVFSKFNIQMASASPYDTPELTVLKQGYNAHIGIKNSGESLNPFIMGGIGYNRVTGDLGTHNWMVIDVEAGFKSKIAIDSFVFNEFSDFFESYADISYIFSVTNFENQLRTLSGLNLEMGVIAFDKVSAYTQLKVMIPNNRVFESASEDDLFVMVNLSVGIKRSY